MVKNVTYFLHFPLNKVKGKSVGEGSHLFQGMQS